MKTALVTGGAGDIGSAVVRALYAAGYATAIGYNGSGDRAQALATELSASGGAAWALHCDVSDAAAAKQAVETVAQRSGKIDLLVNCAGVSHWGLFDETTDEAWKAVTGVDLDGVFYMARAVVPHMLHAKSGAIVNIGSIWGDTGGSCEVAYSAAKAGVAGLTKALAKELAPSGITVNCVSPGAVDTKMLARFTPAEKSALCEEIPLGRLGTPAEIAEAVLFLAQAAYITGQVLAVNGGMYI